MEPFDLDLDSSDFTQTGIFKAIKRQNHFKVLQAIHGGENVHLRDHEFHSTYLHVICSLAESATEEKYLPMIYQLSNAGIDVNGRDYKGRTALELALGRELKDIMAALLRCGTDPTEQDYKQMIADNGSPFEYELVNTIEKYEPGLWSAVKNNETGMLHMLINSWCRVNVSRDGVALLDMARLTGKSQELITILDDYEVTIEFVHATLAGDEKRMLEFLMDSKPCDPNVMDISYQERWSMPLEPRSLRDTAFCMGHMHILHLLPEDEANGNEPMNPTGEIQRPHRHIRDKGRTVTVMAITSLNGYTPGSDSFGPLGNIGEDEDSGEEGYDDGYGQSVMQEIPDEQIHHTPSFSMRRIGSARQDQYRLSHSSQKPNNQPLSKPPQLHPNNHYKHSAAANVSTFGAADMRPHDITDTKSLNVHTNYYTGDRAEIKSLGGQQPQQPKDYYFHEVDGFVEQYYVDGAAPAFKSYVCRPNGSNEGGTGGGLPKVMRKTDKRSTRSKMCVIS